MDVREEVAIYVALIASGLPVVVGTAVQGGPFEGGTSLCLLMIALGALGLGRLAAAARAPRVPPARHLPHRDRGD